MGKLMKQRKEGLKVLEEAQKNTSEKMKIYQDKPVSRTGRTIPDRSDRTVGPATGVSVALEPVGQTGYSTLQEVHKLFVYLRPVGPTGRKTCTKIYSRLCYLGTGRSLNTK